MLRTTRPLLAAVLPVAFLVFGCGDTGPTGSEAISPPEGVRAVTVADDLSPVARYTTRPQITVAWAKAWIGPAGGRMEFKGFAIDVPAGAVDRPTLFSIRIPTSPDVSDRVMAEFGPHGSSFAVPVRIDLPYAGTTAEGVSPQVLWLDESSGAWVDLGGSVTADGKRVNVQTTHFSTYATGGETVIVSGG